MPVANSIFMYFIGNNSSTVTSGRIPENTTVTATGYLNQGDIPYYWWSTVSYNLNNGLPPPSPGLLYNPPAGDTSPGVNQTGNPYASTIDLVQLYNDNYNATTNPISPVFHILTVPSAVYQTYDVATNTSSSSSVGRYIASGQGFYASATGTGQTLTFKEDQKVSQQLPVSGGQPLLMALKTPIGNANNSANLHLQLTNNSGLITQTGFYFNSSYTDAFNSQHDALQLPGVPMTMDLSSFSTDGKRLSINEMADYSKGKRIKLFVNADTSGGYYFSIADINNVDTLFDILLIDKLKKDSVNIRKVKAYAFTISTNDTTTFGANRFELAIKPPKLPPYQLVSFTGEKVSTGVQLLWKTVNESISTGFTIQTQLADGTFSPLDSLQSNGSGSYSYIDNKPAKGINNYRLKQNDVNSSVTYSMVVAVSYDESNVLGVYPNPTKGAININLNQPKAGAGQYNLSIYDSMGNQVKHLSVSGSNWSEDVSGYLTGTYIIELTDNKGAFVGKTKFVKIQ